MMSHVVSSVLLSNNKSGTSGLTGKAFVRLNIERHCEGRNSRILTCSVISDILMLVHIYIHIDPAMLQRLWLFYQLLILHHANPGTR